MENQYPPLNIDVRSAFNDAKRRISRAHLFAQFAVSASKAVKVIDFDKNQSGNFKLFLTEKIKVDGTELESVTTDYVDWTLNQSMREAFEGLDHLINHCYWYCLLASNGRHITLQRYNEIGTEFGKFCKKGFSVRYSELKRKLKELGVEIKADQERFIISLQNIRNCLSHGLGVVSHEFFQNTADTKKGTVKVEWLYLEQEVSGRDLLVHVKRRLKEMKCGEYLVFTLEEILEILFSLTQVIKGLNESAVSKLVEKTAKASEPVE